MTLSSSGPAPLGILNDFIGAKDRALDRIGVAGYHCTMSYICPRCSQGIGIVSLIDTAAYRCERGHSFSAAEAVGADPFEPSYGRLNNLWAPRKWELFLSQGNWTKTKGDLRYTELTYNPTPKSDLEIARNEEFIRGTPCVQCNDNNLTLRCSEGFILQICKQGLALQL